MRILLPLAVLLLLAGCRSTDHWSGLKFDFPTAPTGVSASRTVPGTLEVVLPSDMRAAHRGERIAGTGWANCTENGMGNQSPALYLQGEIRKAVDAARLFAGGAPRYALKAEADALCAQSEGFVAVRAAGIVAITFTLERDGRTVWQRRIDHVVTDADPDYTGSQVTTVAEAMRILMADSLRLVLRDMLLDLDALPAIHGG